MSTWTFNRVKKIFWSKLSKRGGELFNSVFYKKKKTVLQLRFYFFFSSGNRFYQSSWHCTIVHWGNKHEQFQVVHSESVFNITVPHHNWDGNPSNVGQHSWSDGCELWTRSNNRLTVSLSLCVLGTREPETSRPSEKARHRLLTHQDICCGATVQCHLYHVPFFIKLYSPRLTYFRPDYSIPTTCLQNLYRYHMICRGIIFFWISVSVDPHPGFLS